MAAPLRHLRAQATNASGTVDTPAATLRVTPAPVAAFIATSPAAVNVGVGATPSFHVVAGGTPAPTLQWQVSTDGGVNFANVTGATGADLALAAVVVGDNGKQFRVVALNATGTATSAVAMLTVRPPPQFRVAAAGTGLTYQWQLCSAAGAACSNIASATSASVTSTPPAADATVRAVVTNAAGDSATSSAAGLARLHWRYVSGTPTGATMRDLAWLDASTVVAVGDAGVVLRSADSGSTWQAVREAEAARQVGLNGVAFGSAAVGVAVGYDGLLLRTSDGGQHWFGVGAGVTSQFLKRVAFNDAQTVVAVGSNGTVLRSTDTGLTWATVNAGTTDFLQGITFRNGVGLAVAYEGNLFRSINGGAQWTRIPATVVSGLGDIAFASNSVAVASFQNGVIRSSDAGVTWQTVLLTGSTAWDQPVVGFNGAAAGVALPGADLSPAFTTTDGGATWTQSAGWPGMGVRTAAGHPQRHRRALQLERRRHRRRRSGHAVPHQRRRPDLARARQLRRAAVRQPCRRDVRVAHLGRGLGRLPEQVAVPHDRRRRALERRRRERDATCRCRPPPRPSSTPGTSGRPRASRWARSCGARWMAARRGRWAR